MWPRQEKKIKLMHYQFRLALARSRQFPLEDEQHAGVTFHELTEHQTLRLLR